MNPFELIEDDHIILEMCQDWSTETLLTMSKAYSRVYHICHQEIEKRQKKQFDQIWAHLMEKNTVRFRRTVHFHKEAVDEYVMVSHPLDSYYTITQNLYVPKGFSSGAKTIPPVSKELFTTEIKYPQAPDYNIIERTYGEYQPEYGRIFGEFRGSNKQQIIRDALMYLLENGYKYKLV